MKEFPNGFEDWAESHYEISTEIQRLSELEDNLVADVVKTQGRGGLWELSIDWTDEFEERHKGKDWDGEWYDALDEFIDSKMRGH